MDTKNKTAKKDVRITVKSVGVKNCPLGHEPGQSFTAGGGRTPAGICAEAFSALLPGLTLLMNEGRMPWGKIETLEAACPDAEAKVIFELERLPEAEQ